jgi:hypothetical protein
MNFIVKTEPLAQKTLGKAEYDIVGVRGRIFNVSVTMDDTGIAASFFFEFLDGKGAVVGQQQADRASIVRGALAAMPVNMEQAEKETRANAAADSIIKAILAGTKVHKYAAMSSFAKSYGLTLLPIGEQDGILNLEEIWY